VIFILCPDHNIPAGGVRKLYRHVDILNGHGIDATIVHNRRGFRCTWFENDTAVTAGDDVRLTTADLLVFPEIFGQFVPRLTPDIFKVIFNQNAYHTFYQTPLGQDIAGLYSRPDVVAVAVISDDNRNYLTYAFPEVPLVRIRYGFDDQVWQPSSEAPGRRLAYMPRRRATEASQVLHLLAARGALAGWEVVPIDGLSEREVAAALRGCALFLSFSQHEGCPLPPTEALASGCHVIGYHGFGGAEYFELPYAEAVPDGDVVAFARAVEHFIAEYERDPHRWREIALEGSLWILDRYSEEHEEGDVVDFYTAALTRLPKTGRPVSVPPRTFAFLGSDPPLWMRAAHGVLRTGRRFAGWSDSHRSQRR
jgi:hypothetical protein